MFSSSRSSNFLPIGAALWVIALGMAPTQAGEVFGDGSASNNPHLIANQGQTSDTNSDMLPVLPASVPLQSGYYVAPVDDGSPVQLGVVAPLIAPQEIEPAIANASPVQAPLHPPVQHRPLDFAPLTVEHAPLDIDWSVTLRGSHITGTQPTQTSFTLSPQVDLTYEDLRWSSVISAGLTASVSDQQLARIDAMNVAIDSDYAMDRLTELSVSGEFALSQEDVNAPGVDDDVVMTPLQLTGSLGLGAARQMGLFNLSATANLDRTHWTETYLTGDVVEDNRDLSHTDFGGSLRAGFDVTPVLTPFVELSGTRAVYDGAPTSTGIITNNMSYEVAMGLAADWNYGLSGEISAGFLHTDFDEAALADMQSQSFAASLAFAPETGAQLGLQLSTVHNPGDADSSIGASVDYEIAGDAEFLVNDWLNLRASGSGNLRTPISAATGEIGYQIGMGADYLFNKYLSFGLDYTFAAADNFVDPVEQSHTISLGVTAARPQ